MVILLAAIFRLTLRPKLVDEARRQAERGLSGKMEGHAAMDMSVTEGPFLRRLFSGRAYTAISQYFFMNIASLWTDLVLGFLISGALAAWVPDSLWAAVFFTGHGWQSQVWGAFVGPLISVLAFVCSVGNVPLAAVLWRGGISFGGVIAFIFADLIIIPILDIYRKYATMVVAGLLIGGGFSITHATPTNRSITVFQDHPVWDYTTFLNIAFLHVALVLGFRFLRTGGPDMLRMMERAPDAPGAPAQQHAG